VPVKPFKRAVLILTEPVTNGEKHHKLVKSIIFQNKNVLHLFKPVANFKLKYVYL
jgi:hypothetical protein